MPLLCGRSHGARNVRLEYALHIGKWTHVNIFCKFENFCCSRKLLQVFFLGWCLLILADAKLYANPFVPLLLARSICSAFTIELGFFVSALI